jgi:hypothetical protein
VTDFSGVWNSLVAPVASLFNFDFVIANFRGLIDSLFALVTPAQPAGIPTNVAPSLRRPFGGVGRPIGSIASIDAGFRNYFPADVRRTIISAGRASTMVELYYDGYQRLVEPYKLEYYVLKRDGRGLEYFWGWDTTGGKSGKIGIKQFICDKIQLVHPTNRSFQPRFAIEL